MVKRGEETLLMYDFLDNGPDVVSTVLRKVSGAIADVKRGKGATPPRGRMGRVHAGLLRRDALLGPRALVG